MGGPYEGTVVGRDCIVTPALSARYYEGFSWTSLSVSNSHAGKYIKETQTMEDFTSDEIIRKNAASDALFAIRNHRVFCRGIKTLGIQFLHESAYREYVQFLCRCKAVSDFVENEQ